MVPGPENQPERLTMFHVPAHKNLINPPAQRANPVASNDPALAKSLAQRRSDDFKFLVLCEAKGNRAIYDLFRDRSVA